MIDTKPTPEDLARNLHADLEAAESMPPGPWRQHQYPNTGGMRWLISEHPKQAWHQVIAILENVGSFDAGDALADARVAWPAAIRRAIEAETNLSVHGLETCPNCGFQWNYGPRDEGEPVCPMCELEKRQKLIEAYREAFYTFGYHNNWCAGNDGGECRCGCREARAQIRSLDPEAD